LSAVVNFEWGRCCQIDGAQASAQTPSASRVPWLDGSSPITDSTRSRVSGQNFSAQRPIIPPWLNPTIWIGRSARRCIVRSAATTYSAATWMSPIASPGSATVQYGWCRARSAGS
jgi:hypothetical protein